MKFSKATRKTTILAAAIAAASLAATASAEVTITAGDMAIEYQGNLDAEQRELDRKQADLDREQAALDRRKARWRSGLEDASWRFQMLDTNRDAAISESEAAAMPVVDRVFNDLDDNGNKKLSKSEFQDISVYTSADPFTKQ